MEKFDLVVIGSGPAGFSAAMRAIDFGKKVCLIERLHLGGAGIMHGALTSKTMWQLSQDYSIAASVDRGFRSSGITVNYKEVRKTVKAAAKFKIYQMLSQIETLKKMGVLAYKEGHARFVDKNSVEVTRHNEKEIVYGHNFVIATGSRPRPHPEIHVDQRRIINSDGILNLQEFPERIIIIGSGIIGTEFATIFSNFKQTEVHLLDRQHRVIPFEDNDVIDFVSKNLEDNGVIIHHTANMRTIRKYEDHLEVVLDYEDGHSKVIEVDVALISIGRLPNTEDLGLENVGLSANQYGHLPIDEVCKVNNNTENCNIFAAGDVTGTTQLYSVAEVQGRFAAKTIFDRIVHPMGFFNMPTLMFFKPEVAAVGMNEKMLRKRNIAYRVAFYSNELVNRAIAMRNIKGFVKILVSDDGDERILGMRASGPQASAFIVSVAHMMNDKNSLDDIMKTIHPHPSLTEGIQECLRVFGNKSIYKPIAFPHLIKLNSWRPAATNLNEAV